MSSTQTESPRSNLILRGRKWVAPLAWVAVMLDGFDAVVLGATLPKIIADESLEMTGAEATTMVTIGLVGMMIGALTMGPLTDKLGRRKLLIWAVVFFSALTVLIGFADSVWIIGLLRFLAGVGLGGCLPTAISMVTEFAGRGRDSWATTLVMTGYHVGAVLTSLLAIWVAHNTVSGWREMFFIAGIPAVILVPLMIFFLPESPSYLLAAGRTEDARTVANHYGIELDLDDAVIEQRPYGDATPETVPEKDVQGAALLLKPKYRRNSILIWVGSFMGLLLVYGLNNWLPVIMGAAGYDLGNSLGFLVVLNAGAVIGLLIAGKVGDKITPRVAGIIWFAGSALFLALLAVKLPLAGIYVLIFIAGCFVFSSQNLIYAFTASNHPANVRGTALGMSAGIGRLGAITGPAMGGTLVTMGIAYPWGFFAFAIVGGLGAVSMMGMRTVTSFSKVDTTAP